MEPIMEFRAEFSKKDYFIYLQIKKDSIYIGIENDSENNEILYWKKNLDNETIKETTSQMGCVQTLKSFSEMLIEGLSKKNTNKTVTIDFCSLNENFLYIQTKVNSINYLLETSINQTKYLNLWFIFFGLILKKIFCFDVIVYKLFYYYLLIIILFV